jgi:hypothetical protein
VIPIGSTGFAALKIFRKIKIEIDQFPYLTEYQEILQNGKDPKVQVETVMAIINKIIGG